MMKSEITCNSIHISMKSNGIKGKSLSFMMIVGFFQHSCRKNSFRRCIDTGKKPAISEVLGMLLIEHQL